MENEITEAKQRAAELITLERARQDTKWGVQNHGGAIWALIASEELGEVAQAQLELIFSGSQNYGSAILPRDAYITKLTQLAAVCVAWLECELRRE